MDDFPELPEENLEEESREDEAEIQEYDDSSIQVLEGLEAIRKRPGMYIGSTGSEGLHHLIWEALDNAVDEAVAGFAKRISLTIEGGHVVTVEDDGRGLPTGVNPTTGEPSIVTIFTKLHAGGKFDSSSYRVSGGLHGVGVKCVNALSTFFEITTSRDSETFFTRFIHGGQLEHGPEKIDQGEHIKSGTKVRWQPDFSILDDIAYDLDLIKERLERLSFLNKGIVFSFEDISTGEKKEFYSQEGLSEWVRNINEGLDTVFPIQTMSLEKQEVLKKGNKNVLDLELSFQYVSNREKEVIHSFCNNVYTPSGGTHLESVKEGILSCIREIAFNELKKVKNIYEIVKEDITSGISMIVSLRYTDPSYKGQTKESLVNNEIRPLLKSSVDQWLHYIFEEFPDGKALILGHIERSRLNRLHREQVGEIDKEMQRENSLEFAEKLADCTIKNAEFSELYIVEGDSAGGSAKSARNREFQAILPIKGKLINVQKLTDLSKVSKNEEVRNLITAIGCSHSKKFDIEKLKYNKIILMTDADVDGSHIRVLILTFLFKFMTPLLEMGKVYIAQPPLYKASSKKETIYLWTEKDRENFNKTGFEISRFKGLGEMSPAQLWETTMDPARRTFLQVRIVDDQIAGDKIEDLMGKRVEPRREFIERNYFRAELDI